MHHPELLVSLKDWYLSSVNMLVAFLLGTLIGFERQYRQRNAGLRTNTLVALSASTFVDLAYQLNGPAAATQVAAYVVSGVGFLGAGTIMKEGMNVRGLNTAATLWGSAAAGACAGASLYAQATTATLLVLAANTLLRPVVSAIDASPIRAGTTEVMYQVTVIAHAEAQKEVLALIDQLAEQAGHPLASCVVNPFGEDSVEIQGTLSGANVGGGQLDRLVARLLGHGQVSQAYWNPQTSE